MTRILCFGDLHLGAGSEYGRAPGDRLAVQRDVLGRILGIACERDVSVIVNAGDTFDGPGIPPEQLAVFADFVHAAATIEIPVVAISGNGRHDAAMRDVNGLAIFSHIPGIVVANRPTIVPLDDVTVACLPWTHPGRLVAREGGGDRDLINQRAAELLVAVARGLREQAPADRPCVLLFHGSVTGAALPAGLPVDDLREPVLDSTLLAGIGFDAIVCGHIHRSQQMSDALPFFYTGSPLPLNFGEQDVAHGVCVLDTDEREEIDYVGTEFVPIDSPRFVTISFEADPAAQIALSTQIGFDVPAGSVVRVAVRATSDQLRNIDLAQLRRNLTDAGAAIVKVAPDIVRVDRARAAGVDETIGPLAALDMFIDAQQINGEDAALMRDRTHHYLEAVS
jgi:DNA repair exonuclease SbcCD nuclease subunit